MARDGWAETTFAVKSVTRRRGSVPESEYDTRAKQAPRIAIPPASPMACQSTIAARGVSSVHRARTSSDRTGHTRTMTKRARATERIRTGHLYDAVVRVAAARRAT